MTAPRSQPGQRMTLVVASRNPGKLAEIRALLADVPVGVVALDEVAPHAPVVEEVGSTFAENAILKARSAAQATHLVALADDSGLEVDAIGGRPGVRSARYAREGATDAENNAELLNALQEVEDNHRTARFRCVMALVDPFGAEHPVLSEGACEGSIIHTARGSGGFGYDPLFLVTEAERTFAELGDAEKNELSHRGKALRAIREAILDLVRARMSEAESILAESVVGAGS